MYYPINGLVAYIGFDAVADVQVPVVSIALDRVPVSVRAGSDGLVTVTVRFKLSSNPTLQIFWEKMESRMSATAQRVFVSSFTALPTKIFEEWKHCDLNPHLTSCCLRRKRRARCFAVGALRLRLRPWKSVVVRKSERDQKRGIFFKMEERKRKKSISEHVVGYEKNTKFDCSPCCKCCCSGGDTWVRRQIP